jgi:hypothetical protein
LGGLEGGQWNGQTVSIIGGGPSLKGFDFSRIPKHRKVIAINAAFKFCPQADVFFTEDYRFLEKFGAELDSFQGVKVWHCLKGIKKEKGLALCPSLTVIEEKRDDKFWAKDLFSLSFSSNSAVGAINLAEILGASRLFLLGIDCRAEAPMMSNFHDLYPEDWAVNSINAYNFKSDFENWVFPNCKIPSIFNVINPAFESEVKCWPKITQERYINES